MKINIPAALALLLASTQLHAGEIASRFLCTDGTIIRLETNTGPRMTVTWNGNRFPVNDVKPGSYGVMIAAGIPNQTAAILDPLWLDNPTQAPFYATFSTSPKADTVSVQCSPDRGSNRLQF
ncbi:TPA: hypothetical protein MYP05_004635 [Enterobacter roggenkampii]|nr:hypothetical protein [Enterobacter roggenkampii]